VSSSAYPTLVECSGSTQDILVGGQPKTIDTNFWFPLCLMLHVSQKERVISSEVSVSWLFLLFNLPAKQASERVKVWRRLKKFGAVQLKTSTYVLPDEPAH
jgi:hypothetical protein